MAADTEFKHSFAPFPSFAERGNIQEMLRSSSAARSGRLCQQKFAAPVLGVCYKSYLCGFLGCPMLSMDQLFLILTVSIWHSKPMKD